MRSLYVMLLLVTAATQTAAGQRPPPAGTGTPREWVLIFVTSPDCPCNADTRTAELLHQIIDRLEKLAKQRGHTFARVGFALGWSPAKGIDYLLHGRSDDYPPFRMPQWDEVHAGRNWHNEMAVRYMFRDHVDDLPGFPQIILVERESEFTSTLHVGPDTIRLRLHSNDQFAAWLASGGSPR